MSNGRVHRGIVCAVAIGMLALTVGWAWIRIESTNAHEGNNAKSKPLDRGPGAEPVVTQSEDAVDMASTSGADHGESLTQDQNGAASREARHQDPDAPLPPMNEPDLFTLMAAYPTDELRMLAEVARVTQDVPPVIIQDIIRRVRRREDAGAITEVIRTEVPGIPAKTIVYTWAMQRLQGDSGISVRALNRGEGGPLVTGLAGASGPRDESGDHLVSGGAAR